MTVPPHRGVMGSILPGLAGEGISRKLLVHDHFFQGCRIGLGSRVKLEKTICYDKIDPLRPWNPI